VPHLVESKQNPHQKNPKESGRIFRAGGIYVREETTDRVARVAFRDAEPIAGRLE